MTMKHIFKLSIVALVLICTVAQVSDARTRKTKSSTSKTPSIEAFYKAFEDPKAMQAIGLKRIYKNSGKYAGTGTYDHVAYGINVKVKKMTTKNSNGIRFPIFTATNPHAFYHFEDEWDSPTGFHGCEHTFGFKDKADCNKFCRLLQKDGIDKTPSTENGWFVIELHENFMGDYV